MSMHLHFVQAVDPVRGGGMGAAAQQLSGAMRDNGYDSTLLTTTAGESASASGEVLVTRGVLGRFFRAPGLEAIATQLIDRSTAVHAHGLWSYLNLVVPRVAREAGAPLVYHPHGMLEPWALNRSAVKKSIARTLFEKENFESARLWRALTAAEADQIRQQGVTVPIVVIPNGVDERILRFDVGPHRRRTGPRRLLFLGRLHPKKGLDVLLESWSGLGKLTENWELVVAGPDEAGIARALIHLYPSEAHSPAYRFTGLVEGDAKLELLFESDAFVLTSYSEGFPLAVIEAMAASLPVIVSRSCNIVGIEARGAGYECEPSVESVRAALTRLIHDDESSRAQMGANGRRWVESDFRWDRVAREINDACDTYVW